MQHGGFIKVGMITENSPIYKVGMRIGILSFDISKLNAVLKKHFGYITPDVIKKIPSILENPVAISEYKKENTISVFGDIFVEKNL